MHTSKRIIDTVAIQVLPQTSHHFNGNPERDRTLMSVTVSRQPVNRFQIYAENDKAGHQKEAFDDLLISQPKTGFI